MDQDITVLHDTATLLVSVIVLVLQLTLFQNPRVFLRKWLMNAFFGFYLVLLLLCLAYTIRLYTLYAGIFVLVFIGIVVCAVFMLLFISPMGFISSAVSAAFSIPVIIVVELFLLHLHGVFPGVPFESVTSLLIILAILALYPMLPRVWILRSIFSVFGSRASDEVLINRLNKLVIYVMVLSFKDIFMEFYYPVEVAINELKNYVKENMRGLIQEVNEDALKGEIRRIVYEDYGISSFPGFRSSTYGKTVLKTTYWFLERLARGRKNLEEALNKLDDLGRRPHELRNVIAHGHKSEVDLVAQGLLNWGFVPFWMPYLKYYLPRIITFLDEYERNRESFHVKIAERILGDKDVLNKVVEYKKPAKPAIA